MKAQAPISRRCSRKGMLIEHEDLKNGEFLTQFFRFAKPCWERREAVEMDSKPSIGSNLNRVFGH